MPMIIQLPDDWFEKLMKPLLDGSFECSMCFVRAKTGEQAEHHRYCMGLTLKTQFERV